MRQNKDIFVAHGKKYFDNIPEVDSEIYSRELSWSHCYKAFAKFKNKMPNDKEADYLALHLAAYLASWGMYRGNTFLLQYMDYKIHIPVVKMIFEKEYSILWDVNNYDDIDNLWSAIKKLKEKIESHYNNVKPDKSSAVTDTLITKILLGTSGCVPAYDTNVCSALKKIGINSNFGITSIKEIYRCYKDNEAYINAIREQSEEKEKLESCPIMRVIDACLWKYGEEIEKEKEAQKKLSGGNHV